MSTMVWPYCHPELAFMRLGRPWVGRKDGASLVIQGTWKNLFRPTKIRQRETPWRKSDWGSRRGTSNTHHRLIYKRRHKRNVKKWTVLSHWVKRYDCEEKQTMKSSQWHFAGTFVVGSLMERSRHSGMGQTRAHWLKYGGISGDCEKVLYLQSAEPNITGPQPWLAQESLLFPNSEPKFRKELPQEPNLSHWEQK